MAKIAYILLCHKDPVSIIQQAQRLTASGDFISIHFDARAGAAAFKQIKAALADNPNVTFAKKRLKCGWGEWSLVDATLEAIKAAVKAFDEATHFYMMSGDCQAIKSARFAHDFLDARDVDYIESFDFFESDWIKTGMKEERLIYRHYFNERTHKKLFYWAFDLQKRMGWTRKIPEDLQIMIGSQWWCLRRNTIEMILEFTRKRKDVMRFFATTWIPDETFFQTLVRHLVPRSEIESRTLTFLMFTDYGMPVTLYNDHYDFLIAQDYLFARKVSSEALELKDRLGKLYNNPEFKFQISGEGRELFTFLVNRGRHGRRFGQRFWENESSLGRDRRLYIVACKKWHVAKRLVETIGNETDLKTKEYIFSEMDSGMSNLGGIETTLAKRMRHRRALLRMLFDYHNTNDMLICLDTSNADLIEDFYNDRSQTRLLEIECDFNDDYLSGHAKRIGLVGENTPQNVVARLLPTLHQDVTHEHNQIRDMNYKDHYRISQNSTLEDNAKEIAAFLDIDMDRSRRIAATDYLFYD
ncbi:MAG: DUF5928 domain-containing protein [Planktomarina sp.]